MKKKIQTWIKAIVFCALLCLTVIGIASFFRTTKGKGYQAWNGLYAEPDNSLDAIYVGASNVFAYWSAATVWDNYGFTVFSLAAPSSPAASIRYFVEEARKTQPDALYIINLNDFKDSDISVKKMHWTFDYMRLSPTKIRALLDLGSKVPEEDEHDDLEFLFPFIRFHSKWDDLDEKDFDFSLNGYKGSYPYFDVKDVSDYNAATDERAELEEELQDVLQDLLDYIEKEDVNVLFVVVPQALKFEDTITHLNETVAIVESEGYTVLNLQNNEGLDAIGLDLTCDFNDRNHVNIHGSLKYSYYLADYLKENYDFVDKRETPGNSDWDQSVELYTDYISKYTLDFERKNPMRDYTMNTTRIVSLDVEGVDITVNWSASEGATDYAIYRRRASSKGTWSCIGRVNGDTLSYTDTGLKEETEYNYTVVPLREEGEEYCYGAFAYKGLKATTAKNESENTQEVQ